MIYKLKQLWYRRIMWTWCFHCWYNLMFPHIVYPNYTEHPDIIGIDDAHWFWLYLNDFNRVYFEFNGEEE